VSRFDIFVKSTNILSFELKIEYEEYSSNKILVCFFGICFLEKKIEIGFLIICFLLLVIILKELYIYFSESIKKGVT
jgi:hypothetical protein